MSARHLLLAALALLSACKSTSTRPGLRLNGPSAVAVFQGYTTRNAGALHPYMAIADERGNDLRILDAVDGKAVLAPGLIMSLSVPTAPRPALLAAGGLFDATPLPDLLAVAATGQAACDASAPGTFSGCIQVVASWDPATAVAPTLTLDLGKIAGGDDADVLSLVVIPVPASDGAGGWTPAAGQARLVAGLSGGRLLVADFARAADGVAIQLATSTYAPDPASPDALVTAPRVRVHDLGFGPLSMAGSPDLAHLYAASLDPIEGVEGVAELDLSSPGVSDPSPLFTTPTVRALAAGAPTTQVLVATVRPFVALTTNPQLDQYGDPVLRVYAALDSSRCGQTEPVDCGLVTFQPVPGCETPDPAGCLLPDPAGQLPASAPIGLPGRAIALLPVYPPAVGSLLADGTPAPSGTQGAFQQQATATSYVWTSTLAAAATSTGAISMVDLAHGGLAIDRAVLATTTAGTQTRVTSAIASTPPVAGQPSLALWDERPTLTTPELTHDASTMPALIRLTPGYTTSGGWTVSWQGLLPNLSGLAGQLQSTTGSPGLAWLAVQSSSGADAASGPYRAVARLYDPRLAIQVGDVVVVSPADTTACPLGAFELEVTDLLYPSADYPGGAVAVTPRPTDQQPVVIVGGVTQPTDPHCLDTAGRSTVTVTFRAGGLVLTGGTLGYAGRPVPQATATPPGFALAWQDPATLTCPMLTSAVWPPPACDAACRATCEQLLLSRKARRNFYVTEQCASTDTDCIAAWGTALLSNPVGPVVAFKAGWLYPAGATGTAAPARDTGISFNTNSGQVAMTRKPLVSGQVSGAVLPSGLFAFDRAFYTKAAADGMRVFSSYPANEVLDFSPSQAAGLVTVHR